MSDPYFEQFAEQAWDGIVELAERMPAIEQQVYLMRELVKLEAFRKSRAVAKWVMRHSDVLLEPTPAPSVTGQHFTVLLSCLDTFDIEGLPVGDGTIAPSTMALGWIGRAVHFAEFGYALPGVQTAFIRFVMEHPQEAERWTIDGKRVNEWLTKTVIARTVAEELGHSTCELPMVETEPGDWRGMPTYYVNIQ